MKSVSLYIRGGFPTKPIEPLIAYQIDGKYSMGKCGMHGAIPVVYKAGYHAKRGEIRTGEGDRVKRCK